MPLTSAGWLAKARVLLNDDEATSHLDEVAACLGGYKDAESIERMQRFHDTPVIVDLDAAE